MDSSIFPSSGHPVDNHSLRTLVEGQKDCNPLLNMDQNEDGCSTTGINPHIPLIDQFQWTPNNLPIGISYGHRSRISTPGFMKEWTDIPIKQEEEEASVTESSNLPKPVWDFVPRRSPRNYLLPRVSFPRELPIWALLATDFRFITAIPEDAAIWCPSCDRKLAKESFGLTPTSTIPVETCFDCRKGQTKLPSNLAICWSTPSDHQGCGRLLPKSYFSGIYDRETYTGVFCRDCRAFGHRRVRLEGRYNEAK